MSPTAATVRVYWVERGAPAATLLTTDHVRSGALTSWLGVDRTPEVAVSRTEVGPGTALVLTDGLWSALADPATSLTRGGDAQRVVRDLFVAAGEASRVDDQTVAVITVGAVPRGRGGPLAVGDLTRTVVQAVLAVLPRLADRMRPVRTGQFPALLPRGPPMATPLLVLDADPAVVSALEQAGVVDPAGRLIAFGWTHPVHAPGGAIVVFRETLAELEALVAAGHLDPGWFTELVGYEVRYRIRSSPLPQERKRVAAATALLDRLAEARAAADVDATPGEPESRAGANLPEPARPSSVRAAPHLGVGEWDPAFLRELAGRTREDAMIAVWHAQGMSALPTPVAPAERRALLAAGHTPLYRGIHGHNAEQLAEEFRAGARPFVGWAAIMNGSGTNFSTDPATAGQFARIVSLPNPFRSTRGAERSNAVLIGYLRGFATVLEYDEAVLRRDADVAAALRRGDESLALLLADIGMWASLTGVAAVYRQGGEPDRHYLVLDRGAMLVEPAPSWTHDQPE